jgi:hypothetical protein
MWCLGVHGFMFDWNYKSFSHFVHLPFFTGMKDGRGSWNLNGKRTMENVMAADMHLT